MTSPSFTVCRVKEYVQQQRFCVDFMPFERSVREYSIIIRSASFFSPSWCGSANFRHTQTQLLIGRAGCQSFCSGRDSGRKHIHVMTQTTTCVVTWTTWTEQPSLYLQLYYCWIRAAEHIYLSRNKYIVLCPKRCHTHLLQKVLKHLYISSSLYTLCSETTDAFFVAWSKLFFPRCYVMQSWSFDHLNIYLKSQGLFASVAVWSW